MSFNKSLLTQITEDLKNKKKPSKPSVPRNQWQHPGEVTNIPSNNITMQGVSYPVLGVPNVGAPQMMMPDEDYNFPGADNVTEYPYLKGGGQMIKRADGSYSRRGLWDNIRANKGSGKKPTKEMLEQERKIKAKAAYGGMMQYGGAHDAEFYKHNAVVRYANEKLKQQFQAQKPDLYAKVLAGLKGNRMGDARDQFLNQAASTDNFYYTPDQQRQYLGEDLYSKYRTALNYLTPPEKLKGTREAGYENAGYRTMFQPTNTQLVDKNQVLGEAIFDEASMSPVFKSYPKQHAGGQIIYQEGGFVDLKKMYNIDPLSKMGIEKAKEMAAKDPNLKFVCTAEGCAQIASDAAAAYGQNFARSNAWDMGNRNEVQLTNPAYLNYMGQPGPLPNPTSNRVPADFMNTAGRMMGLNRKNNLYNDDHKKLKINEKNILLGAASDKSTANDSFDYANALLYPGTRGYEHIGYMVDNGRLLHGTGKGKDHPAFYTIDNLKDGVSLAGYGNYEPVETIAPAGLWQKFQNVFKEEGGEAVEMEQMAQGGIPQRYKNMGFTHVGQKKSGDGKHKWKVLAKKGDKYKVVQGGYRGMEDFSQHHSEQRKENFWNRMGGRNSAKATDPFSPLYWHKRFGTWKDGGSTNSGNAWYQEGGMHMMPNGVMMRDSDHPMMQNAGETPNLMKPFKPIPFGGKFNANAPIAPLNLTIDANKNPYLNEAMKGQQYDPLKIDFSKMFAQSTDKTAQATQQPAAPTFDDKLGAVQDKLMNEFTNPKSLQNMVGYAADLIEGYNNQQNYNEEYSKQRQNYSTDYLAPLTGITDQSRGQYDMYGQMNPNRVAGMTSFTGMNQKYSLPTPRFAAGGISDFDYIADTVPALNQPFIVNPYQNQNAARPDTTRIQMPASTGSAEPAENSDIKEIIGQKESHNNYEALPKDKSGKLVSSAVGKYQFLWNYHKDQIASVTGVTSKEAFRKNPKAQEQFFDYWDANILSPKAEAIKLKYNPKMSMNDIKQIIHFQGPAGAEKYFATGKFTKDAFGSTPQEYLAKRQEGGEVELTMDEIKEIYRMGGSVEFC